MTGNGTIEFPCPPLPPPSLRRPPMPLTAALQTLLDQMALLPESDQDYLAALFGGYFEAEQHWAAEFERTREQLGGYIVRTGEFGDARESLADYIVLAAEKVLGSGEPFTKEMLIALPKLLEPVSDAVASMFRQAPGRPGSLLRRVHPGYPACAFPLGAAVRFLGYYRSEEDQMIWFWAGALDDYEELIRRD
jgi:hypothetical protein